MTGRHHQCNGHELGETPGGGEGQGGLACCSPCGLKESDSTGILNNNNKTGIEDNITLIVDVNLKNSHSLKVESYVLLGGNF